MQSGVNIAADDRGWRYGDGCFRTIRVCKGTPILWAAHQSCLERDADLLSIRLPRGWASQILAAAEASAEQYDDAVLRVVLSRGGRTRGYRPNMQVTGNLHIETLETTPFSPVQQCQLQLSALRLGWQPRLAGIKHLNRLEQVLATAELRPDRVQVDGNKIVREGILMDQAGNLIGGTRTNFFLVIEGQIKTPKLHRCGVAGATRHWLFGIAETQLACAITESNIKLTEMRNADEIFLTNAVLGICPVTRWGMKSLKPGAVSQQVQACFEQERSESRIID